VAWIADNARNFMQIFTELKRLAYGSSIGLSLSRQIMRLHKGSIRVVTTNARQNVFTLTFSR